MEPFSALLIDVLFTDIGIFLFVFVSSFIVGTDAVEIISPFCAQVARVRKQFSSTLLFFQ